MFGACSEYSSSQITGSLLGPKSLPRSTRTNADPSNVFPRCSAYSACSAVSSSGAGPTEKPGACSAVSSSGPISIPGSDPLVPRPLRLGCRERPGRDRGHFEHCRHERQPQPQLLVGAGSGKSKSRGGSSGGFIGQLVGYPGADNGFLFRVGSRWQARSPSKVAPTYRGRIGDSAPFSGATGPNSRELTPQNTRSSRLKKARNPARMLGLCSTSCPRNSPPPFKN